MARLPFFFGLVTSWGLRSSGIPAPGRMAPLEALYLGEMGVGNTEAAVAKKVGPGLRQVSGERAGCSAWMAAG